MFTDNPSYNPSSSWAWITGVLFAAEGGRLDPYNPDYDLPIMVVVVFVLALVLAISLGLYLFRRKAQGPDPDPSSGDTYVLLSSEFQGTLESPSQSQSPLPEGARPARTRNSHPIQRSTLRCTICTWSLPILSIEDKAALDAAGMSLRDHYDQAHKGWDEEDGAGFFGWAVPSDSNIPDKIEPTLSVDEPREGDGRGAIPENDSGNGGEE